MADAKKFPQVTAALAAALTGFIAGNMLGWSAPAQQSLENGAFGRAYWENEISWVGASMPLGAAIFCVPVGFLISKIGPKKTLLLLNAPIVIGWALILFIPNQWCMYSGRFFNGIGVGGFCVGAPLYICEITQKEIRGMCCSFFQLMITTGILIAYTMAFIPIKTMSYIICAFSVAFVVIFIFVPESPVSLIKRNKEEAADKAMTRLRGKDYDHTAEIKEIKDTEAKVRDSDVKLFKALGRPASKKGLFIALGLMLFQQLCGINAVIFYCVDIFHASGSTLDPKICAIISAIVQVVATFVSVLIVDLVGRRILLMLSGSFMAISTTALGVYFFLKDADVSSVTSLGWLPLVSMCLFLLMFSIGYGPVPWLMMGELFSSEVRGVAASIATLLNWFLAVVVTKTFVDFKMLIGTGSTFLMYSAISVIGVVFVFFCVIETKNKSLNQIQEELGDKPE